MLDSAWPAWRPGARQARRARRRASCTSSRAPSMSRSRGLPQGRDAILRITVPRHRPHRPARAAASTRWLIPVARHPAPAPPPTPPARPRNTPRGRRCRTFTRGARRWLARGVIDLLPVGLCSRPGWAPASPAAQACGCWASGTQNCTGVSSCRRGWRLRRSTGYCSTTKTASRSPPGGLLSRKLASSAGTLGVLVAGRAPASSGANCCTVDQRVGGDLRWPPARSPSRCRRVTAPGHGRGPPSASA